MQYELFPELHQLVPDQSTRTPYTMADFRETLDHYTNGTLNGYAMARKLGRSYTSFKQFVKRNPELKKRCIKAKGCQQ